MAGSINLLWACAVTVGILTVCYAYPLQGKAQQLDETKVKILEDIQHKLFDIKVSLTVRGYVRLHDSNKALANKVAILKFFIQTPQHLT